MLYRGYTIFEHQGRSAFDAIQYQVMRPEDSQKFGFVDSLSTAKKQIDDDLRVLIPRRSHMPPEVHRVAKWIKFGGSPPEHPYVYGWQVDTRDTGLVRDHPAVKWLKTHGFRYKGRKWNLVDWEAPGFRINEPPIDL